MTSATSTSPTKASLIETAERLFAEHGYAGTSLEAIVSGAAVTKGALYHHFAGKQALFEAVFARVEERAGERIRSAIGGHDDPWEQAEAGLAMFLRVLRAPAYRRIVVLDGPAVLGYERYREREERTAYSVVTEVVGEVFAGDDHELDPQLADTFARLFFGALSSAGQSVAVAEDPDAAAGRVETAVGLVLAGLRGVACGEVTSSRR